MFNVISVTSRADSRDFFKSVEDIAKSDVEAIILREKDLNENEYFLLAQKVQKICRKYGKKLIIHNFFDVALKLEIPYVHLSFSIFLTYADSLKGFKQIGTSVHSTDDAVLAEKKGADYVIAGHIFATDCKKGLEPRGIKFLNEICTCVSIPVYAIGGINDNSVLELSKVQKNNFSGVCVMSSLMKSNNPQELVKKIKDNYAMKNDRHKYLLYAVTDRHWLGVRTLEEDAEKALRGGATLLQLREKELEFDKFCEEAEKIHSLCRRYNVPLIINDNVDVAKAVDAEGVHLGQSDMDIEKARDILGNSKIIGATARTVEQAVIAQNCGADYIGSGAVFGTSTKSDAVKMSIETLNEICGSVNIPVTAIGGITKDNILNLKGTKISGVAVVSGIFAEKDIYNSTLELRRKIEEIVNGK